MPATHLSIRDWKPASGCEPTLRIGIVLDEDEAQRVRINVLRGGFEIRPSGGPPSTVDTGEIDFVRNGDAVICHAAGADNSARSAASWTVAPASQSPSDNPQGTDVRDVIAGRGFHWQKRIDQTLPGSLEIRAGGRGLVLINQVPLEKYLACVITSEMGGACPIELLKSQCTVARSWLLAMTETKHDDQPFDRCNDDCCQRYHGMADLSEAAQNAVTATLGLTLMGPTGGVVDANYSKCCGGVSEAPEYVWGAPKPGISVITDAPPLSAVHGFQPVTEGNLGEYLRGSWLTKTDAYCGPNVVKPETFGRYLGRVDESGDYFRWEHRVTRLALEDRLRSEIDALGDMTMLCDLIPHTRGLSGRASALDVVYEDRQANPRRYQIDGELNIRRLMSSKFLYSSAFDVTAIHGADQRVDSFVLRGAGWGHGVGYCQMGALGMALLGKSNEQILSHYFPEARTEILYD